MTEVEAAAYELHLAAGAAACTARKLLPPLIAEIVAAEIGWLKDSNWRASQDRLRLVVAEVEALATERKAAA